jgi:hypothetical protein
MKWRRLRSGDNMVENSNTAMVWQGRGLALGVPQIEAGHARSLPITIWFAPPRASRAPGYTALMARGHVDECEDVERGMAEDRSCLAPRREPLNVMRHSAET